LHRGDGERQLRGLPEGMKVETLGEDFDAGGQAFLDSAAAMMSLDLVITSDTAIAHLAGALGRPVWILLKLVPEWRWLLDREDSPWYPTARLFRQKAIDDWTGAFDDVKNALEQIVNGGAARPSLVQPKVMVSWGELIDKITILEIKSARITNDTALRNVRHELRALSDEAVVTLSDPEVANLKARLRAVNEALWNIEDSIRELESRSQFDEQFIELARSVYKRNDERARIKREINDWLKSEIVEEKSYAPY
jgi:hypothetical protein